ncbi:DYNEIN LIGHT CHAIN [Salix viminalis]|uniref:Dynein light chain n=1 Tax=Salix viminalis TaxID=40686 RepID=A0A9Q0QI35_SALVM|nr:DYNEIN LIGHT CHAIN [Salix viminalis]
MVPDQITDMHQAPADYVCHTWHSSIAPVDATCQQCRTKHQQPLTTPLSTVTKHPSTMLEGKAVVGETDMLQTMQQDALHLAAKALDIFDVTESTDIARFIKKDFDRVHGPGWQCIVGMDFGSFVTHYHGCFIHFCIGNLAILLFKGLGREVVSSTGDC